MAAPAIADAFRLLQSGDAATALQLAQRIARAEPANARAHMASGVALRVLGKLDESRSSGRFVPTRNARIRGSEIDRPHGARAREA